MPTMTTTKPETTSSEGVSVCTGGWDAAGTLHPERIIGTFFGQGKSHGICADCLAALDRENEHARYLAGAVPDPRD